MNVNAAKAVARTSRAGKCDLRGQPERKNQRIARTAGHKTREQHHVGRNKSCVQPSALRGSDLRARLAREHHHQAIVLAGVVPRTPADVEREDPRDEPVRRVQHHGRDDHQQREVQREEFVFFELLARVISAINRRHEMRVIEDDGEQVKGHGPTVRMRRRKPCRDGEKRRGPRAASDDEIEPWPINPRVRSWRHR